MVAVQAFRRPRPATLARAFKQQTGLDYKPPKHKLYLDDTPSPVRAVPEFDPMGGVLIAYPGTVAQPRSQIQLPPTGSREFGIPDELIIKMQQADTDRPVHIFVLCNDPPAVASARDRLAEVARATSLAFEPNLMHDVPWDTDTYWTRDYAPWWVKDDRHGTYGIAKHIYTSLGGGSVGLVEGAEHVTVREGLGIFRPNDDSAAVKFSDYLNAPIRTWDAARWPGDHRNKNKELPRIPTHRWYCTGLLDVGGNFMVTDDGVIASTYLVATQNELPTGAPTGEADGDQSAHVIDARMRYILQQFNRFMGVHKYHVLRDPVGTYIGHIDCWGKFLGPGKVLIAESAHHEIAKKFDDIAQWFAEKGFLVTRVMCQDVFIAQADTPATTAAYTNSLILNDRVYVPLAGPAHQTYDDAALEIYAEALPNHEIIGVIGKPDAPWLGTDALHCRTHGVPREVVDRWVRSQQPT